MVLIDVDLSSWIGSGFTYPTLWSPGWFFTALVIVVLIRFLKILDSAEAPQITYLESKNNAKTIGELIRLCPDLNTIYSPPMLWGRNGHLQTATYGLLGHASLRRTFDTRNSVKLNDGATVTFDVFEALAEHSSGKDITLALCPGIANSSESNYIRTCVHYAQERGYRCAVLNHLGALANVPLTSPRIFNYGGIDELDAMMHRLCELYPQTSFISVGFSMGGNITTRYMALGARRILDRVITCISVCQPYCATKSAPMYHDWENGRRAYNYVITENVKRLLRRHYDTVVAPHVASALIDEQRLWSATSIIALDEHYNRRVSGFATVDDYYRWSSSIHLLSKIAVPIVFLNSLDDPLVPPPLWEPVRCAAEQTEDMVFILTKHGGHLGFLEGNSIAPNSVTWLDKLIVELCNAACHAYSHRMFKVESPMAGPSTHRQSSTSFEAAQ